MVFTRKKTQISKVSTVYDDKKMSGEKKREINRIIIFGVK